MPGIAYFFVSLAYLFIPWFLYLRASFFSLPELLVFFLVNGLIILFILHRRGVRLSRGADELALAAEQVNIQDARNYQAHQNNFGLSARSQRYKSLHDILEGLNLDLDLRNVVQALAEKTFPLIAGGKGACLFYLLDPQGGGLNLFYSLRADAGGSLPPGEGDIFDWWVIRHLAPLLIEDRVQDFRFDHARLKDKPTRPFSSLISAPLLSGDRLLGCMRLDNPRAHFFTQDDLRFLVTVCDLAAVAVENSLLFSRAQYLAIHDELTGLYTKSHFLERLGQECSSSAYHQERFALLMLDIDFFKRYNDTFGHTMGDVVLRKLGSLMRQELGRYDPVLARFGGEEFCVILPGADKATAMDAARALCSAVAANPVSLRRQLTNVTVSIGVAGFPEFGLDAQGLLDSADKALYKAKAAGRNRVCCL